MGPRQWFRRGSGEEPRTYGSRQELAAAEASAEAAEEQKLAALQRECDRIHAGLAEMYSRLPADRRPDIPAEPPRFANRDEAMAYMEQMRALLKRR
ncbi:hypothetical protein [Nocardiopsis protaetiae]|uniref:hypothetical protein n=1 Tax=Nocardiopsis protaetiae TaxID=3382270 RepID=UPI00387AC087